MRNLNEHTWNRENQTDILENIVGYIGKSLGRKCIPAENPWLPMWITSSFSITSLKRPTALGLRLSDEPNVLLSKKFH